MKTIKQIIKSTFIFAIFYIIEKLLLSFMFYSVLNSVNYSYANILLIAISGDIKEIINDDWILAIIFIFHNLLELIAFSVLTSYIFAFILNREPKIIFPDKLVIRHRTSDKSNGVLTLGVLIGNKSKFNIHNVECTINCYYIKKVNPLLTNAEFQISADQSIIKNYFRFSFEIEEFPVKLLKDFLNKKKGCYEEDTITVLITGNANFLGNSFRISKRYHLSDIVFDEHIPDFHYEIKNPFTNKVIYQGIKWDEITKIQEMDEASRKKTVEEIEAIIKK